MNTIKDLALQWWYTKVTKNAKCELTRKYYPRLEKDYGFNRCYLNLRSGYLENIFYNEVIKVWYYKLGYIEQGRLIEKYVGVLISVEQIKEIYLKEHTKGYQFGEPLSEPFSSILEKTFDRSLKSTSKREQPQSVLKTIKIDEVFDGLNDMMEQSLLPKIETIKSVTHCPTCGVECTIGGDRTTHFYIPKTSQPKAGEVDVWDECMTSYFITKDCDNDVYKLFRFLKQHYTLTKK
jgi:hypothetical protein